MASATICYSLVQRISTGFSTGVRMTNWQEINQISKDPQAVLSLAQRLLKLPYATWSEYNRIFLEDRTNQREPLTTRQAEYLIELRNETELYSVVGGFSVSSLVEDHR